MPDSITNSLQIDSAYFPSNLEKEKLFKKKGLVMWRILFKNRKYVDVVQNVTEQEAKEIAKQKRPKSGEPWAAILDPPPAVRHCPGCGHFMAIDRVVKLCPECRSQHNWKNYTEPPIFVPSR